MSRIAKIDFADWDPELRAAFKARRGYEAAEATPLELGMMRMYAHRPAIAQGAMAFGAGIAADRTLPARLTELVRLRIAFHNQCRSCMATRYQAAVEDGVTEDLVCSLERPMEAPDLTAAEKTALAYADAFANDHLSIDDAMFERLRAHFSEAQLVELGVWVAYSVGFGRLSAVWDMIEELPDGLKDKTKGRVAPWGNELVVRR